MARIAGVNIPDNKRVIISLTYIHGIGRFTAMKIAQECGIDFSRRMKDLTEDELNTIRKAIDGKITIEGDLRREITLNIKRLVDMQCYRGLRHRRGLPVRGARNNDGAIGLQSHGVRLVVAREAHIRGHFAEVAERGNKGSWLAV